jgi:hypothetical protein
VEEKKPDEYSLFSKPKEQPTIQKISSLIQTKPMHRKNPIFATDPRTEYQTEKVPNDE